MASLWAFVMRGTSIPFDVLETSKTADASGEGAPMLTRPEEIQIAPARPFTCETMSFHAAEDRVVPALGKEPHAAAPYDTAENQSTVATTRPEPIWIPSMNFEKRFIRLVFYAIEKRYVAGAGSESPVISGAARSDGGRLVERGVAHGRVRRGGTLGNGVRPSSVRFDIPCGNGERSCRISGIVVYEVADARGILLAECRARRVDALSVIPSANEFSTEIQRRTAADARGYGTSGSFGPACRT